MRSPNILGCPILESEINLGRTSATGLVAVESIDIQAGGLIGPLDLAVADYDADGRDDIVVLSDDFCDKATPGKFSILYGEDEQQFSDPVLIADAGVPTAVVSGDVDGDDDIDLIYADFETDSVRVHLNNGNGTFAPVSAYPAGEDPLRLQLDDIDQDGAPDIVAANPVEGADHGFAKCRQRHVRFAIEFSSRPESGQAGSRRFRRRWQPRCCNAEPPRPQRRGAPKHPCASRLGRRYVRPAGRLCYRFDRTGFGRRGLHRGRPAGLGK